MAVFLKDISAGIHKIPGSKNLIVCPKTVIAWLCIYMFKTSIEYRNDFPLAPVTHIMKKIPIQHMDLIK